MSPPHRYNKDHKNNQHHQQNHNTQSSQQHMVPLLPPTPNSAPNTPIPLYPTGAAAIIPAPPTYELIPNRIFVGGFPLSTTESDLRDHFERFYAVKDVKIVKSLDGQSKGYGFITFDTEDQAEEIRQLDPKQLEFRNRNLNLGPAIRKMNSAAFPPGYAIAAPNQLISASPGPFGYAVPASPGAGGSFTFPASQPMFVYPPRPTHDLSRPSPDQHLSTPQLSPTGLQQQQSTQVFFGGDQEPMRTYASAVTGKINKKSNIGNSNCQGIDKAEPAPEERHNASPQPLMANQNLTNNSYSQGQQQWNGNEQQAQQQGDSNNGGIYYDNYSNGYAYQSSYSPYAQTGVYMNSQGVFQPSYSYMTPPLPGCQYPPMMPPPYWQPQSYYQKNGGAGYGPYNNNYIGPSGDMGSGQYLPVYNYYPPYSQQQNGGTNDENALPRPLQPPRAGRKNRKPSEGADKKKNSKFITSTPSSPLSGVSNSFQNLSISSPTAN